VPRLDDSQVMPILDFWRDALRLTDWDFRIVWTDKDLTADFGYLARAATTPHLPSLKAEITIDERQPWLVTIDYWAPANIEETIIHELVHVRLAATETAIDSILHIANSHIPPSLHPVLEQQLSALREAYVETVTSVLFRMVHPEPKET